MERSAVEVGCLKRLLPYGVVVRWLAAHRGINIERPPFFYPELGKRLKRIVKFALPYGLVMWHVKRAYPQEWIFLCASPHSESVPETPMSEVPPPDMRQLPSRAELECHVLASLSPDDRAELKPDVTVVTVIFNIVNGNRVRQFRQCLASVQNQVGVSVEHLIVDGGSRDGTLQLLESHKPSRHTMRVFSAPDKGIYEAMNRGLVLANGRYVTFLNSDDFYHDPLGLRDSVAALDASKAEFSYAPVIVIGEDGNPVDHPNACPDVRRLYCAMEFCHQSVVLRTDAFRAIGGFDTSYRSSADYDSVMRMIFRSYHVVKVDRTYVTFRTGGFSWMNMELSRRECGRMFARLYGHYLNYKLTPEEGYRIYVMRRGPIEIEERVMQYVVKSFGLQDESLVPRSRVSFLDHGNVFGLYGAEEWGAWSAKRLRICNRLRPEVSGCNLLLSLYIGACKKGSGCAFVEIKCNGRFLSRFEVSNFMPARHDVFCPAEFIGGDEVVLDLETSDVVVTASDPRELGLSFERVEFAVAGVQDCESTRSEVVKVGFLNFFYYQLWMGGVTYFTNLFRAMQTVRDPILKPYIRKSGEQGGSGLREFAEWIEQDDPPPGKPTSQLTAQDYGVDVISHLQEPMARDGIAWITDFQHKHLPELFDAAELKHRDTVFRWLAGTNRLVIVSSDDARRDFASCYPEYAHKARRLRFVSIPEPEALADFDAAEVCARLNIPERFFYIPNQFWKHKNHIVVFKAIARLKKRGVNVTVVCSGKTLDTRLPGYFDELMAYCKSAGIEENVRVLGLVDRKDVYVLQRQCVSLINPSRFEGWSSSVEEAKSVGKTIILSNLNVHIEQDPPKGRFFPVDDDERLACIMEQVWNELPPGPDVELERLARERLPERIRAFGEEFKQIVLEAYSAKR